jgi:hypothetical protein
VAIYKKQGSEYTFRINDFSVLRETVL